MGSSPSITGLGLDTIFIIISSRFVQVRTQKENDYGQMILRKFASAMMMNTKLVSIHYRNKLHLATLKKYVNMPINQK